MRTVNDLLSRFSPFCLPPNLPQADPIPFHYFSWKTVVLVTVTHYPLFPYFS